MEAKTLEPIKVERECRAESGRSGQTATTKVKEAITLGIMQGQSQDRLTKTLNKLIARYCSQLENPVARGSKTGVSPFLPQVVYQVEQTIQDPQRTWRTRSKASSLAKCSSVTSWRFCDVDKVHINAIRPLLDQTRKGLPSSMITTSNSDALKARCRASEGRQGQGRQRKRKGYTYVMSLETGPRWPSVRS